MVYMAVRWVYRGQKVTSRRSPIIHNDPLSLLNKQAARGRGKEERILQLLHIHARTTRLPNRLRSHQILKNDGTSFGLSVEEELLVCKLQSSKYPTYGR